jgi:hypothetical protein
MKWLELVEREAAVRLSTLRERAASRDQFDHRPAQWFARGVVEFSPPTSVFAWWLLGLQRLGKTKPCEQRQQYLQDYEPREKGLDGWTELRDNHPI